MSQPKRRPGEKQREGKNIGRADWEEREPQAKEKVKHILQTTSGTFSNREEKPQSEMLTVYQRQNKTNPVKMQGDASDSYVEGRSKQVIVEREQQKSHRQGGEKCRLMGADRYMQEEMHKGTQISSQ